LACSDEMRLKNASQELLEAVDISLGFAHSPAIFLRRFFIISITLHVPY